MTGRIVLEGIATRDASRAPMRDCREARITPDAGVEGDLRGRPGPRQVTVLAAEGWEAACAALGETLPWTTRRANLLVRGAALAHTEGSVLQIGDVLLEITRETEPCLRMEEARAGLRRALAPDWRGGVCCRVVSGGTVHVGQRGELRPAGVQGPGAW